MIWIHQQWQHQLSYTASLHMLCSQTLVQLFIQGIDMMLSISRVPRENKPLPVKSLPVLSQCLLDNVDIMILTNSSQLIWRRIWRSSSPSTPASRIISSTYSPGASLRGWS